MDATQHQNVIYKTKRLKIKLMREQIALVESAGGWGERGRGKGKGGVYNSYYATLGFIHNFLQVYLW